MVECLSFHAVYRCAHSGACCRTGWNVPFTDEERHGIEPLDLISGAAFVAGPEPGVRFAARRSDGACVFLDEATRLCTVHRAAGQSALPLTCRMFPRIARHDPIGTRLSLSHYCPTAAGLLFTDTAPLRIVTAPDALIDVGPLDGLDARAELPPLLRPDVLMDLESYRAWESRGVQVLTSAAGSAQAAVDRLFEITREITPWKPGSEPLLRRVQLAFEVLGSRALDLGRSSNPVQRWLAARLFGNWIAYQARGLETIVRYLQACLDAFTIELARDGDTLEAIRRADYLLMHESESQELADLLS
jgi:Fe-S-cluster containining protein